MSPQSVGLIFFEEKCSRSARRSNRRHPREAGRKQKNRNGRLPFTVANLLQKRPDARKPAWLLERVKGIEPSCAAWKAAVLPLNYTRMTKTLSWPDDNAGIDIVNHQVGSDTIENRLNAVAGDVLVNCHIRQSLSENSHGIESSSSSSSSSCSKTLKIPPGLTMRMSMRMRMNSRIPIFQTRSQAGTKSKRPIANAGHAVGNRHTSKACFEVKSIVSNDCLRMPFGGAGNGCIGGSASPRSPARHNEARGHRGDDAKRVRASQHLCAEAQALHPTDAAAARAWGEPLLPQLPHGQEAGVRNRWTICRNEPPAVTSGR